MNGKEAIETIDTLTDALEETRNRWHLLADSLHWADDKHIQKLIDNLVAAQPALDDGTAQDVATIAQKLHGLFGQAEKLSFALKAQSAGLERLLKRIEEAK